MKLLLNDAADKTEAKKALTEWLFKYSPCAESCVEDAEALATDILTPEPPPSPQFRYDWQDDINETELLREANDVMALPFDCEIVGLAVVQTEAVEAALIKDGAIEDTIYSLDVWNDIKGDANAFYTDIDINQAHKSGKL